MRRVSNYPGMEKGITQDVGSLTQEILADKTEGVFFTYLRTRALHPAPPKTNRLLGWVYPRSLLPHKPPRPKTGSAIAPKGIA